MPFRARSIRDTHTQRHTRSWKRGKRRKDGDTQRGLDCRATFSPRVAPQSDVNAMQISRMERRENGAKERDRERERERGRIGGTALSGQLLENVPGGAIN